MYVRFALAWIDADSRMRAGIFHAAYDVVDDERMDEWLRTELRRELAWFDEHLPVPCRFTLRSRRPHQRHGVCWFRPQAVEHISRGHYVAWLLHEADLGVGHFCTMQPGAVLYHDAYQVVALSGRHMLTI